MKIEPFLSMCVQNGKRFDDSLIHGNFTPLKCSNHRKKKLLQYKSYVLGFWSTSPPLVAVLTDL